MSIIYPLLGIGIAFLVGFFAFAWWQSPRARVLPHLSEVELKQLETEDRLRQTTYQVLAGVALVFTFCLTVIQATTSYQQWR